MINRLSFLALLFVICLPLNAEVKTISGTVVEAESRELLGQVAMELLENGESRHSATVSAKEPFSFEYDFDADQDYKLVFNKADYYKSSINLSNALAGGKMPKQLRVSMSGEEASFIFWGESRERETGNPISNAVVTQTNLMTGEQTKIQSNIDGRYSLTVTSGYEYGVTIESGDHLKRFGSINYCNDTLADSNRYCFFGFSDVTLNEQGSISGASIMMDKIRLGKKFKVENIYYDSNKATMPPEVLPNLRKLLYTLEDNPQIIVELGSHADSRGSDAYNLSLSQRRAEAAVKYIVSQGIDRSRIRAKGYGETQLANRCANGVKCNAEEHKENRRTEFVIVGIDKTRLAQK